MQIDEFKFLIGKLSTSIGSTLALNKTILHEAVKNIEARIVPDQKSLTEEEFLPILLNLFKDFSNKVTDFNDRLSIFNAAISKDRLPSYLKPGQKFLGKFLIEHVMSMQEINKHNALVYPSVFVMAEKADYSDNKSEFSTKRSRRGSRKTSAQKAKPSFKSRTASMQNSSRAYSSHESKESLADYQEDMNDDSNAQRLHY